MAQNKEPEGRKGYIFIQPSTTWMAEPKTHVYWRDAKGVITKTEVKDQYTFDPNVAVMPAIPMSGLTRTNGADPNDPTTKFIKENAPNSYDRWDTFQKGRIDNIDVSCLQFGKSEGNRTETNPKVFSLDKDINNLSFDFTAEHHEKIVARLVSDLGTASPTTTATYCEMFVDLHTYGTRRQADNTQAGVADCGVISYPVNYLGKISHKELNITIVDADTFDTVLSDNFNLNVEVYHAKIDSNISVGLPKNLWSEKFEINRNVIGPIAENTNWYDDWLGIFLKLKYAKRRDHAKINRRSDINGGNSNTSNVILAGDSAHKQFDKIVKKKHRTGLSTQIEQYISITPYKHQDKIENFVYPDGYKQYFKSGFAVLVTLTAYVFGAGFAVAGTMAAMQLMAFLSANAAIAGVVSITQNILDAVYIPSSWVPGVGEIGSNLINLALDSKYAAYLFASLIGKELSKAAIKVGGAKVVDIASNIFANSNASVYDILFTNAPELIGGFCYMLSRMFTVGTKTNLPDCFYDTSDTVKSVKWVSYPTKNQMLVFESNMQSQTCYPTAVTLYVRTDGKPLHACDTYIMANNDPSLVRKMDIIKMNGVKNTGDWLRWFGSKTTAEGAHHHHNNNNSPTHSFSGINDDDVDYFSFPEDASHSMSDDALVYESAYGPKLARKKNKEKERRDNPREKPRQTDVKSLKIAKANTKPKNAVLPYKSRFRENVTGGEDAYALECLGDAESSVIMALFIFGNESAYSRIFWNLVIGSIKDDTGVTNIKTNTETVNDVRYEMRNRWLSELEQFELLIANVGDPEKKDPEKKIEPIGPEKKIELIGSRIWNTPPIIDFESKRLVETLKNSILLLNPNIESQVSDDVVEQVNKKLKTSDGSVNVANVSPIVKNYPDVVWSKLRNEVNNLRAVTLTPNDMVAMYAKQMFNTKSRDVEDVVEPFREPQELQVDKPVMIIVEALQKLQESQVDKSVVDVVEALQESQELQLDNPAEVSSSTTERTMGQTQPNDEVYIFDSISADTSFVSFCRDNTILKPMVTPHTFGTPSSIDNTKKYFNETLLKIIAKTIVPMLAISYSALMFAKSVAPIINANTHATILVEVIRSINTRNAIKKSDPIVSLGDAEPMVVEGDTNGVRTDDMSITELIKAFYDSPNIDTISSMISKLQKSGIVMDGDSTQTRNEDLLFLITTSDILSLIVLKFSEHLTLIIRKNKTVPENARAIFNICMQLFEETNKIRNDTIAAYNNFRRPLKKTNNTDNKDSKKKSNEKKSNKARASAAKGNNTIQTLEVVDDNTRILEILEKFYVCMYIERIGFYKMRKFNELRTSDAYKQIRRKEDSLTYPFFKKGGSIGFLSRIVPYTGTLLEATRLMTGKNIAKSANINPSTTMSRSDEFNRSDAYKRSDLGIIQTILTTIGQIEFKKVLSEKIANHKRLKKPQNTSNDTSKYDTRSTYLDTLSLNISPAASTTTRQSKQLKSRDLLKPVYDTVPILKIESANLDSIGALTKLLNDTISYNAKTQRFEASKVKLLGKYVEGVALFESVTERTRQLFDNMLGFKTSTSTTRTTLHDVVFYNTLITIFKHAKRFKISNIRTVSWFSKWMEFQPYINYICYTSGEYLSEEKTELGRTITTTEYAVSWMFNQSELSKDLKTITSACVSTYVDAVNSKRASQIKKRTDLANIIVDTFKKYLGDKADEYITTDNGEDLPVINKLYRASSTYRLVCAITSAGTELYKQLKKKAANNDQSHSVYQDFVEIHFDRCNHLLVATETAIAEDPSSPKLLASKISRKGVTSADGVDALSPITTALDFLHENPAEMVKLCVNAHNNDVVDNIHVLVCYNVLKLGKRYLKKFGKLVSFGKVQEYLVYAISKFIESLDARHAVLRKVKDSMSDGILYVPGNANVRDSLELTSKSLYLRMGEQLEQLRLLRDKIKTHTKFDENHLILLSDTLKTCESIFRFSRV